MKSKERIEKIKNTKKKNGYVVSETTKLKISNSLKGKRCGDNMKLVDWKHLEKAQTNYLFHASMAIYYSFLGLLIFLIISFSLDQ